MNKTTVRSVLALMKIEFETISYSMFCDTLKIAKTTDSMERFHALDDILIGVEKVGVENVVNLIGDNKPNPVASDMSIDKSKQMITDLVSYFSELRRLAPFGDKYRDIDLLIGHLEYALFRLQKYTGSGEK